MNKWTAGPWRAHVNGSDGLVIIRAGHQICIGDILYHPENVANAHLISAAPELYNALQMLHDDVADYLRINHLGGYDNHFMRLARAALAKARGES